MDGTAFMLNITDDGDHVSGRVRCRKPSSTPPAVAASALGSTQGGARPSVSLSGGGRRSRGRVTVDADADADAGKGKVLAGEAEDCSAEAGGCESVDGFVGECLSGTSVRLVKSVG